MIVSDELLVKLRRIKEKANNIITYNIKKRFPSFVEYSTKYKSIIILGWSVEVV